MTGSGGAARRPRFPATLAPATAVRAGSPPPLPRSQAQAPVQRAAVAALTPMPRTLLRPQGLMQQAAAHADSLRRPGAAVQAGVGMDSTSARERMVQRLAAQGLAPEPVLAALRATPRHRFVDPALVAQAYEDTALPIGLGQTISKPSIVARMLALLMEGEWARRHGSLGTVLEVGSGCGYQAAVLARLGRRIVSIERLRPLFDKAQQNLADEPASHVRLVHGDGCLGHAPLAPYHSVIAAAGGDDIPAAWIEQLAPGGRLVAPMQGTDPASGRSTQVLVVVDQTASGPRRRSHEAVLFVPLKSGIG